LFQYLDDGSRHPIDSGQVNQYLKDAMGAEFTAKDFRTWGATLQAIAIMARTPLPESTSESALNACIVAAVKQVATQLRNTPAVCRKSYINPIVFAGWRSGALHRTRPADASTARSKSEQLALAFLRQMARAADRRLLRDRKRPWRGRGRRAGPGGRMPPRRCAVKPKAAAVNARAAA
jgi:DNA topoisomerase IB